MSLHQCEAVKPDGKRCGRPARAGEHYCYNHRNYQPKAKEPLSPSIRITEHVFQCDDCHRPIWPKTARLDITKVNDEYIKSILCEPCFRLRRQIEDRIAEICSCPGGLSTPKVHEDLARFGVDEDLVDAAMQRMYADGRLVRAPVGGDTA